jgi:hypothetical protein
MLPASLKLLLVGPPILACDSYTKRKSAPFRVGANLEPLYGPLQTVIRFLRLLIPARPTASLAGYLPRTAMSRGDGGRSGLLCSA